ncbi:MAG: site-specific integrase, partial [Bacteroidales bacterium]|nr:site-specific integrase [Bacteroidales bacterium]
MAKISFTLDPQIGADGKQVLNLRFAANNTRAMLTTPYRLYVDDWDDKNKKIRRSCKYYKVDTENAKLIEYINEATQFILSIPNYDILTAGELKQNFIDRKKGDKSDFYALMEAFAEQKAKENPDASSARSIMQTKRMLETFEKRLETQEVTPAFLKKLEIYLKVEKNLKINSVADYMTNIRTVYNYAITNGYAKRDNYPFATYKIKRERTRHRVVAIDDMHKIFSYTPETSGEAFALDMFKLSFFLIGINFKDMLNLQWKDVYRDRITYRRLKTGRDITVRIEPEAYEIINRHKGEKRILNILEQKEKTAKSERKSQLHTDITKTCNKHLKKIFEKL